MEAESLHDAREGKLSRWVRDLLLRHREVIWRLQDQALASRLTADPKREWFTLPGPLDERPTRLWTLSRDGAHPVCSLYQGDLLLIARALPPPEAPGNEG